MSHEVQLWIGLGCCALYTIIAFIFYRYPPKEINLFYGYRTKRSMANPEIWKVSNEYSALFMLKMALAGFVVPVLMYFLFPQHNLLVTLVLTTLMLISVVWFTKKYLDRYFDKDGNPKKF